MVIVGFIIFIVTFALGVLVGIWSANQKSHITPKDCKKLIEYRNKSIATYKQKINAQDFFYANEDKYLGRIDEVIDFFGELDNMFDILWNRHKY